MPRTKTKAPHKHRWVEDSSAPGTGVGAEWHFDCACGRHKYVWIDAANERHTEITDEADDADDAE